MKKNIILAVVVLLLASVVATLLLLRSTDSTPSLPENQAKQTQLPLGGDRDEHGCIMSAGYSWCEQKNKCLRVWEEPCISDSDQDQVENLKTEIKSELVKKHGQSANDMDISVLEISGDYAKGGASQEGMGGGMWFAAKVDGDWKLVWDGNGAIFCSAFDDYSDFPVSMVPECYDDASQEMMQR